MSNAQNGTAGISGKQIIYIPDPGFIGNDMLSYTIEDSQGVTAQAEVVVSAANQQITSIDVKTIYGKAPTEFGDDVEIVFPDDPAIVINVRDFEAQGDGIADDTQAIQNAVYAADESKRALYFPNGVYRITQEIRFENADGGALRAGPHLYGQSRDGVVLKLDDNAVGFRDRNASTRAVIRAVNAEDGTTYKNISADFFNRYISNITIDTGDNPGAVGIKFYSNNTGVLKNVRIIGNGAIGLDLNSIDLNGPNLVQNLEVDGFNIGVSAAGANSSTLSNVTIRNSETYALYHTNKSLQVEGLIVENAPIAVHTSPADTRRPRTTLTLVNGEFRGGDASQPAILNGGVLFARNIATEGYAKAIQDNAGITGDLLDTTVSEYSSHSVSKAFSDSTDSSLNLPIQYQPFRYAPDPSNWVSVQDYNAIPGDQLDDTSAIQATIDAASAAGKTTVYFPGDASSDPNWYNLDGDVLIHGSVNHLIGFAPARILGDGEFQVIEDAAGADVVKFQGFNFTRIGYENASSRTVIFENATGDIEGTGTGEIFINSFAGRLFINNPEMEVWARQLNTEKADDLNIVNDSGTLWLLGHKTEKGGIKSKTLNGGKTEILGAYILSVGEGDFGTVYEVLDSNASFAGIRERTGTRKYSNFVHEVRGDESHFLSETEVPADNEFNRGIALYSASVSSNLISTSPLSSSETALTSPIIKWLNRRFREFEWIHKLIISSLMSL